jgi:peroxiredoxin
METVEELTAAAEDAWLSTWTAGPLEPEGTGLPKGATAPDLVLNDETGAERQLSEFWAERPALVMFWRHFGCGCGVTRARRLVAEHAAYVGAGLNPVIVAQGEPARAAAYRERHGLPCPVLSDPDRDAYRAYGIGQWSVERILYDAPHQFLHHERDLGMRFQAGRAAQGTPLVDDPWRAVAEFVVGADGQVQLPHVYQYCEDFPEPRVLTAAARLSRTSADPVRA